MLSPSLQLNVGFLTGISINFNQLLRVKDDLKNLRPPARKLYLDKGTHFNFPEQKHFGSH